MLRWFWTKWWNFRLGVWDRQDARRQRNDMWE